MENFRRSRVISTQECPRCPTAPVCSKRKPQKMRLPHEELTIRQLVQHMRDTILREKW